MSEITRNLGYNDIKMLRKNSSGRKREIMGKEKQRLEEDRQIERQD